MADLLIRSSFKGLILGSVVSVLTTLIAVAVYIQTPDITPVFWALIAFILAIDIWGVMKYLRLAARRLTLDNGILRFEDGLVSKTQRNIVLDKIRDVGIAQTLAQRLVGVGDLSVEVLGESGNIALENVDRPRQAADAILEAMRQSRQSNR